MGSRRASKRYNRSVQCQQSVLFAALVRRVIRAQKIRDRMRKVTYLQLLRLLEAVREVGAARVQLLGEGGDQVFRIHHSKCGLSATNHHFALSSQRSATTRLQLRFSAAAETAFKRSRRLHCTRATKPLLIVTMQLAQYFVAERTSFQEI